MALTGGLSYDRPPGCDTWYVAPPSDTPLPASTTSNTSGESGGIVGCSELGGAQARYRTPATCRPGMCVGRNGTGKPLQVTHTCPEPAAPVRLTCSRSTEESTYRAVPPAVASSPRTCQGSIAQR